MKTYSVHLKKLVKITLRFLRRVDVPYHLSKAKNERYDVHVMLVLYSIFCLADKSYARLVKNSDENGPAEATAADPWQKQPTAC